jgi:hypothetical protein
MVGNYDSSEELFYCPDMISKSCRHGGRSGVPALMDIIDLEAQRFNGSRQIIDPILPSKEASSISSSLENDRVFRTIQNYFD